MKRIVRAVTLPLVLALAVGNAVAEFGITYRMMRATDIVSRTEAEEHSWPSGAVALLNDSMRERIHEVTTNGRTRHAVEFRPDDQKEMNWLLYRVLYVIAWDELQVRLEPSAEADALGMVQEDRVSDGVAAVLMLSQPPAPRPDYDPAFSYQDLEYFLYSTQTAPWEQVQGVTATLVLYVGSGLVDLDSLTIPADVYVSAPQYSASEDAAVLDEVGAFVAAHTAKQRRACGKSGKGGDATE